MWILGLARALPAQGLNVRLLAAVHISFFQLFCGMEVYLLMEPATVQSPAVSQLLTATEHLLFKCDTL